MIKQDLVALYVRVSTLRQVTEGYSIQAQEARLREEVQRQGKVVFKVYCDAGISGAKVDRPGLLELLNDAHQGKFASVGVWNISRMSRNLPHLLQIISEFELLGIGFFSLSEQFDIASPIGKFSVQILGSIAQMQRETLRENCILGSKRKAQKGKYNSVRLLGYRLVEDNEDPRFAKKLEIVPEEASIVRTIYDLYCEGKGFKAIATTMNKRKLCGKNGKSFSIITVREILTNPAYIGKVKYAGEYYAGLHDPIISVEQWGEVQKLIASKNKPVKNIDYDYLLSGIVKCPQCGKSMIPTHVNAYNKSGAKRIYYYYSCSKYLNKGACRPNVVRAKEMDKIVLEFVAEYVNNEEWQQKILDKFCITKEKKQNCPEHIKKLEKKKRKLLGDYEHGNIKLEEFLELTQNINTKIDSLNKILSVNRANTDRRTFKSIEIKSALKNFSSVLANADIEKKKKLIRNLIKAVYVDKDKNVKSIELNVPSTNNCQGQIVRWPFEKGEVRRNGRI